MKKAVSFDSQVVVRQVNVGQGDGSVILEKDKKGNVLRCIVIDGGKSGEMHEMYSALKEENVSKIDLYIVTHYDADHTGFAQKLMDLNEKGSQTEEFQYFQEKFKDTLIAVPGNFNVSLHTAKGKGDKLAQTFPKYEKMIKDFEAVNLRELVYQDGNLKSSEMQAFCGKDLLADPSSEDFAVKTLQNKSGQFRVICIAENGYCIKTKNGKLVDNIQADNLKGSKTAHLKNARSLSVLIQYQDFSFYTAGDLSENVEKKLAESFIDSNLQAQCFKTSHHGAETSSPIELFEALQPQIILVSASDNNSYNHPRPKTVSTIIEAHQEQPYSQKQVDIICTAQLDKDIKEEVESLIDNQPDNSNKVGLILPEAFKASKTFDKPDIIVEQNFKNNKTSTLTYRYQNKLREEDENMSEDDQDAVQDQEDPEIQEEEKEEKPKKRQTKKPAGKKPSIKKGSKQRSSSKKDTKAKKPQRKTKPIRKAK